MPMKEEVRRDELGRQLNPEPVSPPLSSNPSLWLYTLLFLIALAMLAYAVRSRTQDWPGFLLNLATEILGALIILLLVERRLRANELKMLKRAPKTTWRGILIFFFPSLRQAIGFVQKLNFQMEKVAKPYYLPRADLESQVEGKAEQGLILMGPVGCGKTTLLHHYIRKKSETLIEKPRRGKIPILVSCRMWSSGDAAHAVYNAMRGFYNVSARVFRKLLRNGRLICIFDNIDESLNPEEHVRDVKQLRDDYPGNAVIVSIRDGFRGLVEGLEFQILEVPPLRAEETARLLELREQCE